MSERLLPQEHIDWITAQDERNAEVMNEMQIRAVKYCKWKPYEDYYRAVLGYLCGRNELPELPVKYTPKKTTT